MWNFRNTRGRKKKEDLERVEQIIEVKNPEGETPMVYRPSSSLLPARPLGAPLDEVLPAVKKEKEVELCCGTPLTAVENLSSVADSVVKQEAVDSTEMPPSAHSSANLCSKILENDDLPLFSIDSNVPLSRSSSTETLLADENQQVLSDNLISLSQNNLSKVFKTEPHSETLSPISTSGNCVTNKPFKMLKFVDLISDTDRTDLKGCFNDFKKQFPQIKDYSMFYNNDPPLKPSSDISVKPAHSSIDSNISKVDKLISKDILKKIIEFTSKVNTDSQHASQDWSYGSNREIPVAPNTTSCTTNVSSKSRLVSFGQSCVPNIPIKTEPLDTTEESKRERNNESCKEIALAANSIKSIANAPSLSNMFHPSCITSISIKTEPMDVSEKSSSLSSNTNTDTSANKRTIDETNDMHQTSKKMKTKADSSKASILPCQNSDVAEKRNAVPSSKIDLHNITSVSNLRSVSNCSSSVTTLTSTRAVPSIPAHSSNVNLLAQVSTSTGNAKQDSGIERNKNRNNLPGVSTNLFSSFVQPGDQVSTSTGNAKEDTGTERNKNRNNNLPDVFTNLLSSFVQPGDQISKKMKTKADSPKAFILPCQNSDVAEKRNAVPASKIDLPNITSLSYLRSVSNCSSSVTTVTFTRAVPSIPAHSSNVNFLTQVCTVTGNAKQDTGIELNKNRNNNLPDVPINLFSSFVQPGDDITKNSVFNLIPAVDRFPKSNDSQSVEKRDKNSNIGCTKSSSDAVFTSDSHKSSVSPSVSSKQTIKKKITPEEYFNRKVSLPIRDPRLSKSNIFSSQSPRKENRSLLLDDVGKRYIETDDLRRLVLEWNVDSLEYQMRNRACPSICISYPSTKDTYESILDYYNTLLPLHLLNLCLKIFDSWKFENVSYESFFEGKEDAQKFILNSCTIIVNTINKSKVFKESDFLICKIEKEDGRIKQVFGQVVSITECNISESIHDQLVSCRKLRLKIISAEYLGVPPQSNVTLRRLVNVRLAFIQNDALRCIHSSVRQMVLAPKTKKSFMHVLSLQPFHSSLNLMRCNVDGILRCISKSLVSIVRTQSSSDSTSVIPNLVEHLIKQNYLILICVKDESVFLKLAAELKLYHVILAVLGEEISRLSPHLNNYLVSNRDSKSLHSSLVVLTLVSATFFAELELRLNHENVICIIHEAQNFAETETALYLRYNINRLILFGNHERKTKTKWSVLQHYGYDVSLFDRFWRASQPTKIS